MEPQVSLAIIDDEKAIRDRLAPCLIEEGYHTSSFPNGVEALRKLQQNPPEIIILDILMPQMDGVEFCKRWRAEGHESIIIFLSSKDSEDSKINALLSGGDDYLTKPFSIKELLVRINVCRRRLTRTAFENPRINPKGLFMDLDSWIASYDGQNLILTVSEFRILYKLYHSPGRTFTRDQLIEAAYEEDPYISDRNTDAHIKRIRKKLNQINPSTSLIDTVYGVGYRYQRK